MIEYHNTPEAAVRTMAEYITCPQRIQSEVYVSTGYWMNLSTVKQYQALAQRAKVHAGIHYRRDIDRSVVDSDQRHRDAMSKASRLLAEKIIEARENAA